MSSQTPELDLLNLRVGFRPDDNLVIRSGRAVTGIMSKAGNGLGPVVLCSCNASLGVLCNFPKGLAIGAGWAI